MDPNSGANKLYRDSGLGLLVNTVVTAAGGAVATFLAGLPAYASVLVAGGAGIVLNAITAWKAKREATSSSLR